MPSVHDSKAKLGSKTANSKLMPPPKKGKAPVAKTKAPALAAKATLKSSVKSRKPAEAKRVSTKSKAGKSIVAKTLTGKSGRKTAPQKVAKAARRATSNLQLKVTKPSQLVATSKTAAGAVAIGKKLAVKMRQNGTTAAVAANAKTLIKTAKAQVENGAAQMDSPAKMTKGKANGAGANANAKRSSIVLPSDYQPSESEPFMNERHRTYFRNKLVAWKEDILRQNMETLKGLHDESSQQADPADRATAETDRALELRARDRQRKLMGKIDSALARIEEGSYGFCEETGEPISLKRLDARPIATLSLEAQERRERRERVFRED